MTRRAVNTIPNLRPQKPIPLPPPERQPPPGSAGNLRGIPVIARGSSGTAPGTAPHVDGARNADRARRPAELGLQIESAQVGRIAP